MIVTGFANFVTPGTPALQATATIAACLLALQLAQVANPDCKVLGCAVNTAALSEDEANAYLAETEARMGIPCVDPFRHGAGRLVDAL